MKATPFKALLIKYVPIVKTVATIPDTISFTSRATLLLDISDNKTHINKYKPINNGTQIVVLIKFCIRHAKMIEKNKL